MDLMAQLNAITDLDWFEIQGYEAKELRDFILEKDKEIERLREALQNIVATGREHSQLLTASIAEAALQQKDSE